jgi:hypothetical protein
VTDEDRLRRINREALRVMTDEQILEVRNRLASEPEPPDEEKEEQAS